MNETIPQALERGDYERAKAIYREEWALNPYRGDDFPSPASVTSLWLVEHYGSQSVLNRFFSTGIPEEGADDFAKYQYYQRLPLLLCRDEVGKFFSDQGVAYRNLKNNDVDWLFAYGEYAFHKAYPGEETVLSLKDPFVLYHYMLDLANEKDAVDGYAEFYLLYSAFRLFPVKGTYERDAPELYKMLLKRVDKARECGNPWPLLYLGILTRDGIVAPRSESLGSSLIKEGVKQARLVPLEKYFPEYAEEGH